MRVLSLNCGSSSLKFDVIDASEGLERKQVRIARGAVEGIGRHAAIKFEANGNRSEESRSIADHGAAVAAALDLLRSRELLQTIDAVGHRVVHGGPRFREPTLIDDDVLQAIEAVSELAPLHNEAALQAIATTQTSLRSARAVATFDTAFYSSMPEVASIYAIPHALSEKHSIRRYGFHGLAHRYMIQRYRQLRPEKAAARLVTLQLGNGCSATASHDGRPIDTSMGFTPLEGLIMGTRSGDIDPSLPLFIAEREGWPPSQVESLLNKQSGLLALSGHSADMRDLLEASAAGDQASALAVEVFCYRVKKYVGAYLAALGGAEAVIFGGGIGEYSAEVRARARRRSHRRRGGARLDGLSPQARGYERRTQGVQGAARISAALARRRQSRAAGRDEVALRGADSPAGVG